MNAIENLEKKCKEFGVAKDAMGLAIVLINECLERLAGEVEAIERSCSEVIKENLDRWQKEKRNGVD